MFDSGGLSLKTASGMETMKTDMSGAAAVIGAMSVLQDLGVKTKVVAFTPMVENMPSGTAIRPGDVLKIRNGKTVEVLNTDAEGRLILADGLSLAAEEKPDAIIDLATLTGACVVALGEKIAGLMTTNDSWGEQVRAAADSAGEPVWPLPLPKEYNPLIESEIADLKNIGTGGYGGALDRRAVPRRRSSATCRGCTSTSRARPGPRRTTASWCAVGPASGCARSRGSSPTTRSPPPPATAPVDPNRPHRPHRTRGARAPRRHVGRRVLPLRR